MVQVAAALGHQNGLAARRAAETRGRIAGGHAQLLNALHRRRDGPLLPAEIVRIIVRVSRDAVADVAAIQQYAVLIAVRTRHLPAEVAALLPDPVLRHRGGLQQQRSFVTLRVSVGSHCSVSPPSRSLPTVRIQRLQSSAPAPLTTSTTCRD